MVRVVKYIRVISPHTLQVLGQARFGFLFHRGWVGLDVFFHRTGQGWMSSFTGAGQGGMSSFIGQGRVGFLLSQGRTGLGVSIPSRNWLDRNYKAGHWWVRVKQAGFELLFKLAGICLVFNRDLDWVRGLGYASCVTGSGLGYASFA